jgi:hypothetical protein
VGRETLLWQVDFTSDELHSKMSKAKNEIFRLIISETESFIIESHNDGIIAMNLNSQAAPLE